MSGVGSLSLALRSAGCHLQAGSCGLRWCPSFLKQGGSNEMPSLMQPATHAVVWERAGVAILVFCAHGTMAARDAVLSLDAAADPAVLPGACAAWRQSGGRGREQK